jgi:hypothetical protein
LRGKENSDPNGSFPNLKGTVGLEIDSLAVTATFGGSACAAS